MGETSSSPTTNTKLERIASMAKEMPGVALSTLAHHIDVEWLREAYRRTRKDGARGIDGQSAEQYAERLEENLVSLLQRAKSGTYRAPAVRRVHIPKGDGSQTRPIGIPTFEDKVLQRAVAMVLEAVYEQEFHDFSYGFRPGLHEVLDEWFVREVRPRLKGKAVLVRYADDFVFVFARKEDAERVLDVLPKRFGKYGLTLHPDKTRLVPFERPDKSPGQGGTPGTFNMLGFTYYWGRSRRGTWIVKQRTAKDRFSRTLRRIRDWCRTHRHDAVKVQHHALWQKLNGHYGYFGVTHNYPALARLRDEVGSIWRKWLSRRSQKSYLTWTAMHRLLERYPLPKPRIVHSYIT